MTGLATWAASRFRCKTKVLAHLVQSSGQFVKAISQRVPVGRSLFIKLDVKDFFLSGSIEELCRDGTLGFEGEEKKLLDRALWLILDYQYVKSANHPDKVWKSRRGSGMGLVHSGDLMDWVLFAKMEKWFAKSPGMLWEFGITGYYRYRDDVLILATDAILARRFIDELLSRAGYFKILLESASRTSVRFLDVSLCVVNQRFVCLITSKSTALVRPLCVSSRHAPHVHRCPIACIRRIRKLANTTLVAREAQVALIERLKSFAATAFLICLMQEATSEPLVKRSLIDKSQSLAVWIRLPSHPAWHSQLNGVLAQLSCDDSIQALYFMAFRKPMPCFRAAWCTAGLPLAIKVDKHSAWLEDGAGGWPLLLLLK